MQPGGERAEIAEPCLELLERRIHDLQGLVGRSGPRRSREPEVDGGGDELLLRAVVQVAFEPAPLLIAGLHEPRP